MKIMKKYSKLYLYFIVLVSAMGGLLFGYDWVVIGGAKLFYELSFDIADSIFLQGWAMSSALIGCLVGAIGSGALSDRYGRKRMLIFSALFFIISAVGAGASKTFITFVLFRVLGGIGIGMASNLSPMYIAEIAPASMRGRLVSLNQMTIVLGILAAQVTNWLLAEPVPENATMIDIINSWNVRMGWRWMFWAMNVPAVLFFLLAFFLPESPRWLALKGHTEESKHIFECFLDKGQAENELASVIEQNKGNMEKNRKSGFKKLFHPSIRGVLLIGVVIAVFQQWCGINIIFNYAHDIFASAGYGVSDTMMNIVVTGITNVIFTALAFFLVDKLGRRLLLLLGAGGLTVIYIILGMAYHFHFTGTVMLLLVIMAIACYAMTLAPITWVVISEIFPNSVRSMAMSVSTFALWTASFFITYTFPALNSALGASGTFWLYGGICIVGFIFIFFKIPETKNKSLEEIESQFIWHGK